MLGRTGFDPALTIPALSAIVEEDSAVFSEVQSFSGRRDLVCIAIESLVQITQESGIDQRALSALSHALGSSDAEHRIAAANALGAIGASAAAAAPALIEQVRATLIDARSHFGVGVAAVTALGHVAPDSEHAGRAVSVLTEALDSRLPMQLAAAKALGEFGAQASAAVPKLRRMLSDEDPYSRKVVEDALKNITEDRAADGIPSP